MNKIDFILFDVLNALQVTEGSIKGHLSVNNVKKTSLSKNFPNFFSQEYLILSHEQNSLLIYIMFLGNNFQGTQYWSFKILGKPQ